MCSQALLSKYLGFSDNYAVLRRALGQSPRLSRVECCCFFSNAFTFICSLSQFNSIQRDLLAWETYVYIAKASEIEHKQK